MAWVSNWGSQLLWEGDRQEGMIRECMEQQWPEAGAFFLFHRPQFIELMLDFANILDLCKGSARSCSVKTALLLHLHFPHLVSVKWMDKQCLDLSLDFGYWEELRLLLSATLWSFSSQGQSSVAGMLGSLKDGGFCDQR